MWQAEETTAEERKRLVRCLIREAVLRRDDGPKRQGGITSVRIGWRSGTWSELAVHRPSSSEHLRTPADVLARLHTLAQELSDERVAEALNGEGLRTRTGLAWTAERVQQIRGAHGLATGYPRLAQGRETRGDGLVPLGVVAARLGVARSLLRYWQQWGFLYAEQARPGSPLWVRWTDEDRARLDGTLAARGYGQWRLREAERVLGVSKEAIWQRARQGDLVAYRARVGDHGQGRLSPANDQPPDAGAAPAQGAPP